MKESVAMASSNQILRIKQLIEIVKIEEEEVAQWLNKADASFWIGLTSAQIEKCIQFVESKIKEIPK